MLPRWLLTITLAAPLWAGCDRSEAHEEVASARPLAPLHFSDGTSDLMLTWIGPRGDTHVETRPDLVPDAARGFVRVLISDSRDGTTDPIYVADLGAKEADGGYTARSLPRTEWEAEIARRREAAGGAGPVADDDPPRSPRQRRPDAAPPPPPEDSGARPPAGSSASKDGAALVTIYGAEWCGPCHQAQDHLKRLGIAAVFKDIEADPSAAREMQSKLEKSGARRGAIPVIDVGGKIIVGYSQGALDRALRDLRGGTAL